jgi:hypothetical protein
MQIAVALKREEGALHKLRLSPIGGEQSFYSGGRFFRPAAALRKVYLYLLTKR